MIFFTKKQEYCDKMLPFYFTFFAFWWSLMSKKNSTHNPSQIHILLYKDKQATHYVLIQ